MSAPDEQMTETRLDRLVSRLREAEPPLDQLTRARVEARLRAPRPPRTWPRHAGVALAMAAGLAIFLGWPKDRDPPALAPFLVSLPPSPDVALRAERLLAEGDVLEAPEGGRIEAALGDRGVIALVGPGRLRTHREGEDLVVDLEVGVVLGRWQHGQGRLRIEAPGARVAIVGTVFSVDTDGHDTRVGVLVGAIDVDGTRVEAGRSWRAGALGPLAPDVFAALVGHAQRRVPPRKARVVGLVGDPARVQAWVGGESVGRTPLWLKVAPGDTLRLDAEGRVPAELVPPPAPEEARPMIYALATRPAPPAPPPPPPEESPPPPPAPRPAPPRARSVAPPPVPDEPEAAPAPIEPSPPPSPPSPASADRYRDAEAALRSGDVAAARRALLEVAATAADPALVQQAIYELARLSFAARELPAARRYLDELGDTALLAEPADHLRCRVDLADRPGTPLASCVELRRRHPTSSHDAEIRAQLALRLPCPDAVGYLEELLRAEPDGPSAPAARRRLAICTRR